MRSHRRKYDYWRAIWQFLKTLDVHLPHDPAIPLLGIYLEKLKHINIHPFYKKPGKNVHRSFIHINPKLETTQMYINHNQIWTVPVVEYYLAMKKNDQLKHAVIEKIHGEQRTPDTNKYIP